MKKPLVSVIIPVYNGANYLGEAIDSVLKQTYPNIEIVVINDGSSDEGETEKVAVSYGEKIRYFRKDNGGVASALNQGIKKMQGEYFAWLSHDDVFYPQKIEKQVEVLQKNNVLISACGYQIFYDTGRKIDVPTVDFYGDTLMKKGAFSVLNGLIHFAGVLLDRKIFEKYGYFCENLKTTQDDEFLFRVLRREECAFLKECLCGVRYHEMRGSYTIPSVGEDRDNTYVMYLTELSRDEKENMYGTEYNFYYNMLVRIMGCNGFKKSLDVCINLLKACDYQTEAIVKAREVGPIWIYGAGIYGRRLLFDLRCRNYKVEGFIDGNKSLQGTMVDGVICNGEEIISDVRGTIIIASVWREEIAQHLKEKGIDNYMFKESFDKEHITCAPSLEVVKNVMEEYYEKK